MRLIDVNALKNTLMKYNYTTAHNQIFRYIDEQPTAYDVDKVVEQLEKEFRKYYGENWKKAPYLAKAIKIVHSGGKE